MNKELEKKVKFAISLIQAASRKAAEIGQPVEVCYSGGKDSDVILELTRMADVPYRAIYKNTTIDPPYTIKHCKDNGVEIMKPKKTMKQILQTKGLPSKFQRFCCSELKEYKILDYAILGVRADESVKRKLRYTEPEECRNYSKKEKVRQYFPILWWSLQDEEAFINERGLRLHPLYYDENGKLDLKRRLGCIGCPLATSKQRIRQFKRYPKMVNFFIENVQMFYNSKPNLKSVKVFHQDASEAFAWQLLCETLADWREIKAPDLWGNVFDHRKWLEDTFGIKLKPLDNK